MRAIQVHWTELLRDEVAGDVTSMVSARELREAEVEVGEAPARWALRYGVELAEKVGGQLPALGRVGPAFTSLRSAMQSTVLGMLIAVRLGGVRGEAVSEEARDSIRVCVEAGIRLETVLAGVRRGHRLLVERLMQECRVLAPQDGQSELFAVISEVCFDYVGQLADGLTALYSEEEQQWLNNPRAERLALVSRILQGGSHDLVKAAASLRYEIEYRDHLSVCVWCDDGGPAEPQLEAAAVEFLRIRQASQTLVTRQSDATVLAWGNSRGSFDDRPAGQTELPEGIRIGVGAFGRDVDGFRDSAYQARQVQVIVNRLPGLAVTPVVTYADVSLAGLLSNDVDQARRFVQTELGALADYDDHNERILETLQVYLDSHSPQAVAQQLFIARNTVTYRLRRAEQILGRPITVRPAQLRVAILLARALRGVPPA